MGTLIKTVGLKVCATLPGNVSRGSVPVLTYHSVDESGSYVSTSADIFRAELEGLAQLGYTGMSVSQLMTAMRDTGALPEQAVVITFDDGLQNFLDTAWPALRAMDFSATLYVPTDFVGGSATWFADHGIDPMPLLDWDGLRALEAEGADIQSHGCSHRRLTALTDAEITAEVRESRSALQRELAVDILHFCCPYGAYNAAVKSIVAEAGYHTMTTTTPGLFRASDDVYEIRRLGLDFISIPDVAMAHRIARACTDGSYARYLKLKLALHGLREVMFFRGE